MRFCTIIALNYVPFARVLAGSLNTTGEAVLSVLVLDDHGRQLDDDDEPFEVVRPGDLDLSDAAFLTMAAIYDVMELATAVKPWLLQALMDRGEELVTYLDPDIEVFSRLQEVEELSTPGHIVLTPHRTAPMPRDGLYPEESDLLVSGTWNLGFISVRADASAFLRWWQARLAEDCIVALDKGLFVDQRWIELAIHCFPFTALRHPGYNVAYWNLDYLELKKDNKGYTANGLPLRFFHYSGFDPGKPDQLSKHMRDRPRVRPMGNSALAELCAAYGRRLVEAEYRAFSELGYGFGTSVSGIILVRELRRAFREATMGDRRDRALPSPFLQADAAAFDAWARSVQRTWLAYDARQTVRSPLRHGLRFGKAALLYAAHNRGRPPRQSVRLAPRRGRDA